MKRFSLATAILLTFCAAFMFSRAVRADPDRECIGFNAGCVINGCYSPCDGYSCCIKTAIPFTQCDWGSGNCDDNSAWTCGTTKYYLGGDCFSTSGRCNTDWPLGEKNDTALGCSV